MKPKYVSIVLLGAMLFAALPVIGHAAPAPQAAMGAIEGFVYEDADGDGALSLTDPGVEDSQVLLFRDDTGQIIGSVKTDASGAYRFDDLAPGTYTVEVIPGSGQKVIGTPFYGDLDLAAGEVLSAVDFGLEATGDAAADEATEDVETLDDEAAVAAGTTDETADEDADDVDEDMADEDADEADEGMADDADDDADEADEGMADDADDDADEATDDADEDVDDADEATEDADEAGDADEAMADEEADDEVAPAVEMAVELPQTGVADFGGGAVIWVSLLALVALGGAGLVMERRS